MDNRVYYGEYSLKYWIELMLKGNIELPDYQRCFAWEEEQFKVLVESFKTKQFIPPVTIGAYKSENGNKNYIIDGQQRLTCILLAYLDRFPKKEAGNAVVDVLVNDNDDELETDEENTDNMIEWTFQFLTAKGNNKPDILSKCNPDHYKTLNLNLDDSFFSKNYLGFSYIVPGNSEATSQQRFFSTVFRNINIQGKSLYTLESRASLYFLNSNLKEWFYPEFTRSISSSVVDKSKKSRMDFVRYLSLLSQYYKINDESKVAYRYARRMEDYYESYIYSVVNDDDSMLFGKFSDIYPGKDYRNKMDSLSRSIAELNLSRLYTSIIDMDINFFGLIYVELFLKHKIDVNRKEELTREITEKIALLKEDGKHTKTPSMLKYLRTRIKDSIDIYLKYIVR